MRRLPNIYWSEKYFKQYTSLLIISGQIKWSVMLCLYRTRKFLNLFRHRSSPLPIFRCVRLDEKLVWFGNLDSIRANSSELLGFSYISWRVIIEVLCEKRKFDCYRTRVPLTSESYSMCAVKPVLNGKILQSRLSELPVRLWNGTCPQTETISAPRDSVLGGLLEIWHIARN
jgi:hypothetical protein